MKRKRLKSFTILLTLAVAFCQMKAHASANAAESIAENVTESTVESAVEGTAESAVESTAESAAESTVESTAESTPEIAAENAPENVTVPTVSSELISVELPMIEERNPFNFFIDPLHIFYNTFSNSGGDITVEEDTCLLFYNRDESGDALSSRSDSLEIINRSTVPIEVTITAKIENADGIAVVQNKDFADRSSCDLYLALVDNEGNEQPLSVDGEVSIAVYLDRAPLDAYAYVLNKDTGEYQYVCQSEDVAFDTYSFGLMGACNEKGDWANISSRPHVTISWNVEPVVSEESGSEGELDKKPEENFEEEPEDITESSAPAGDVPDEDGESSGGQAADGDENSTEDVSGDTEGRAPENDRPDEKETTEESGSDTESSGADEADGDTASDGDGRNEENQAADDNGDSAEDVTSAGDSDVGNEDSEKDVSDGKGTTEESGSDTESSGTDETNEEITPNEDNQNEGELVTGGDEHPTEDESGDKDESLGSR